MKEHGRGLTRTVLALAIALIAALGIATPASAATLSSSAEACIYNVDTGEYGCYPSEAALDAAFSARGIELVEARTSSEASLDLSAIVIAPMASYIYARLYENSGYGGTSLSITGSNSGGCGAGVSVSANLPSTWNDRVSSFQGYLSCKVRLAEHTNQGGTLYGPYSSSSSLGSFNDKASSYRLVD